MKKFAFIGAGSFGFTRNLVRDILSFPSFADCTIALMDIDEERLGYIKQAVDKIVAAGNYPAKVIATTNRAEALQGADGVVCTILANSVDVWRSDIEIPKKYGVDINVGDTRGPAGVFRALRTIPVMLDICRDIEEICPNAVFLNYTNPMTMLCNAMQNYTKVNVVGLCHSVQGTAEMLAGWIGAEAKDTSYLCGGINHQAWFLEYKWNGKDAIPLIREKITSQPDIYNAELVRNEMFLHLDYYVTESSGHNSEYNAWFRKRPDLIEKYCTHGTNWNPGVHAYILDEYLNRQTMDKDEIIKWLNDEPIDLNRGHEYASEIFNAMFGDGTMFKFYGNIRNKGYITNLPPDVCVEVPVLASKAGFEPIHVGALPPQLTALNTVNAINELLAVEGSMTGDPRKVFHAIVNDPLTAAVLSLDEIKQMVDEMFAANRDYLPQFNHVN
ncbi:alpha-galactosidase [Paenibacillus nasutitermitis]|uniref:Alpha-glucosidase/alpha-galactosidase n=1 Tax=Paenibacillus nasutitermitis TaxID=1652958 RepID=A0A916YU88_9BACL|nr:alpha-galactosidase [Paenibacillus nasutitermitis]GGD60819.1 alpha-glucosidase/alpha-galactosidase [Paenibacillus nasutitermitis]